MIPIALALMVLIASFSGVIDDSAAYHVIDGVKPGEEVVVEFNAFVLKSGHFSVGLHSPDGAHIKGEEFIAHRGDNVTIRLSYLLGVSEPLRVRVAGIGRLSYTIKVMAIDRGDLGGVDAGDTPSKAITTSLTRFSGWLSGYRDGSDWVDWYKLTFKAGRDDLIKLKITSSSPIIATALTKDLFPIGSDKATAYRTGEITLRTEPPIYLELTSLSPVGVINYTVQVEVQPIREEPRILPPYFMLIIIILAFLVILASILIKKN